MKRRDFLRNIMIGYTGIIASSNFNCIKKVKKLNFVILFSDELNPEYLECYNKNSIFPTSNISKLAQDGIRFTNAYSTAPMCTPARFSMLTGMYPGKCTHSEFLTKYPDDGMYNIGWNTYIDNSTQTLPKILKKDGYITGMMGKWHIGTEDSSVLPFQKFHGNEEPNEKGMNEKLAKDQKTVQQMIRETGGFDHVASAVWGNFDHFPVKKLRQHNFPWINKGVSDFLDDRAEDQKPFFTYIATTAIHGPSHLGELKSDSNYTLEGKLSGLEKYELDKKSLINEVDRQEDRNKHKYTGLAYLDHHVGFVINKLENLGLLENTVVMFIADHNIEPGKATCYEQGNKIPMIVKWPGKKPAVCSQLVQNIDMVSTIIDASGKANSKKFNLDGVNVLSLINGENNPVRESVYVESGFARAVRKDNFKYIAFRLPKDLIHLMENGKMEYAPNYFNKHKQQHSQIAIEYFPHYFDQDQLYDLENDPYEMTNLAYKSEYQEILGKMKIELKKYLDKCQHTFDLKQIPFMETPEYKKLTEKTKSIGIDYISWLPRDHGTIVYPPVKNYRQD